jgi:asparagine synthase (glutamine-hydrolysing)
MILEEEEGRVDECWKELEPFTGDTDELGAFQALEIRSSLPDKLLMYADKLSMAHGLEVRVPYLDKEIVEYVERLPATFKVRRGRRKWLHRKVCEQFLPPTILNRKKRGFAVDVVDDWFQNAVGGNMDGYLLDPSSLMFDFLKPVAVKRLLDDHRSGRSDNYKALFNLVVLEEWLRSSQSAGVASKAEPQAVAASS